MTRFPLSSATLGVAFALVSSVVAIAQTPASVASAPPPAPAVEAVADSARATGDRSYVLGLGDIIQVSVLGRSEFDARGRIGSDGTVLLPYLGAVPASGRSPAQLADEVRTALEKGGYYARPLVRVEIISAASRVVTVLGYVGQPGLVPLDRDYRLSELIARVGGRTEAGADYVLVTRGDAPSERFGLLELATGGPDKDPLVRPGDKIYVPSGGNEVFYLNGQVKAPGAFPLAQGMTVRMALAKGGGVSENGNEKKVKIIRKGQPVKSVKLDETVVEPGDIITIGERMF